MSFIYRSSEKSFEALKENVYQEVSALIVANESRPNFLINLFRELQLISTSDPLRNRLMQTFQDLYNRYESNPQADNSAILNQVLNVPSSSIKVVVSVRPCVLLSSDVAWLNNCIDSCLISRFNP